MDLDWSPDDFSSSIQRDDSQAGSSTGMHASPGAARSPTSIKPMNGLFAIDDFDFEALIEILGTNGEADRGKGKERNGALDDLRLMQNSEQRARHNDAAFSVAQATRSPRSPVHLGTEDGVPRAAAGSSSEPVLPPPSNTKAPKEPAIPCNPTASGPPPLAVEQIPPLARIPRTLSPGTSRSTGKLGSQERAKTTAKPGFTQLKEQFGTSVSEANGQVIDLRSRIQILKDEVKEFAPHLYRRAFDIPDDQAQRCSDEDLRLPEARRHTNAKEKGKDDPSRRPENGELRKSELEVISALSEEEAKSALVNICRTLRINPSNLVASSTHIQVHDLPVPPSNLSDLTRALQLVSDMDELVWRNTNRRDLQSRPANGQTPHNIYDEDNIQAILDRVRLWERTARSRDGRRSGV